MMAPVLLTPLLSMVLTSLRSGIRLMPINLLLLGPGVLNLSPAVKQTRTTLL